MKRLLKLLGVLIVILVLAAVAGFFFIDTIARKGVEQGGAYALGVETRVEKLDLQPFAGKCSLGSLRIANPEGFEAPSFLVLKSGELAVKLKSLLSETVLVPRLELNGIDLALEQAGGRSNYSVILENLRRHQSGEAPQPQPKGGKGGKKYHVGVLDIRDVKVQAAFLPLSGAGGQLSPLEIQIPAIHLTEVGSDTGGGVTLPDLFGVVIRAILDAVAREGGGRLPPEMLSGLNQNLDRLKQSLPTTPDILRQPEGLPGGDVLRRGTDILRPRKEEKRP